MTSSTLLATRALNIICQISQNVWFRSKILALQTGEVTSPKSSLLTFNPFLDTYGILRVGSRQCNSQLAYDSENPIILRSCFSLAELLVRHIPKKYYYSSRLFMLAHLQARFWIHGRALHLVKKVIRHSVWCAHKNGHLPTQIMGDLPTERTLVSKPFAFSAVYFAGPFIVKCTNHRTYKLLK